MSTRYLLLAVMLSVTAGLLPWCAVAQEPAKPAAKLDGVVITEAQVEQALARAGVADGDRGSALERVIAQHILSAQATREHLDQDPAVVAAIDDATRAILSQAYLDKQARQVARPTPQMIKSYYDEHPALFSERAVYKLQEVNIRAAASQLAAVNKQYDRIKTLAEMVDWLQASDIPHTSGVTVVAAEEMPSDLLVPVSALQPGQVVRVTTDVGIAIVQLVGKRTEALTLAAAQPAIERILLNRTLGEQLREAVSRLKQEATIEYFPPYSPPPYK